MRLTFFQVQKGKEKSVGELSLKKHKITNMCGSENIATIEKEDKAFYFASMPKNQGKKIQLRGCKVFFDFDNTITTFDVLDGIIKKFSVDKTWVKLEKLWKENKIGSKECLGGQLKSVRISREKLFEYLDTVKLDSDFIKLLAMLRKNDADVTILSDSFCFVIKYILMRNGLKGIRVYSNRLRLCKDRLVAIFPYVNKSCRKCANCKKSHVSRIKVSGKVSIYIGDGLSDLCAAQHTDLTFAKASLLDYLRKNKKPYIEFKHLKDVHEYLKGVN